MKWYACLLLSAAFFFSSCGRRKDGGDPNVDTCEVVHEITPAEWTLEWGLAAIVAVGLLMVVAGVIGIALAGFIQAKTGLSIGRKGLWTGILLGVALVATALALEIIIWPVVVATIGCIVAGLAYGAYKVYHTVRAAHMETPPE